MVYNHKGTVWYIEEDGSRTELLYRGYDKSTDSLRYGFKPQKQDKRIFRIKCEEDRRIFTPVARKSHKWKSLYKKRTGVERINGSIDRDYQFERHTIRGLAKMTMFITVSFLIYMVMAKSRIEKGQTEHLCRLYA
ncbi:MAG: transposase [Lachnospiraceae bacterium]|nr:transposase [Lachnospiraceae bacterium]MDE6252753.1 transposase [Lachnospiraceae bacterium]